MKEKILAFVHNLLIYDYMLFGAAFVLFLLFIILAILVQKRLGLAVFFILLGLSILLLSPTLGYLELHKYLFKNSTKLISQKKLTFVDAIVVHGRLTNESKFNFKECIVKATVYKVTPSKLKNYIFRLKPMKEAILVLNNIPKGTTQEFKMFVEPFTYSKEYNLTVGADCR